MLMDYEVVTWPESQDLMEKKGFSEHCELINSEKGLDMYGSCAYLVEKEWLEQVEKGLIPDRDDDEDELIINYDFPYDDEYDDDDEYDEE